ncbi:MAG: glucose-1-phosphate cytidylyltransferase [Planctomycetota bacterium]
MKVVLFCGGFGMRLRGYSESIPKPLVTVGDIPILLQIMQYYASFGHKEFILCLGWKAESFRSYFTDHPEGGPLTTCPGFFNDSIALKCEFRDWTVSFIDTGMHACVGERLKQLEPILKNEDYFYANYADGLCNVDLDSLTAMHLNSDSHATFVSVAPTQSFHTVNSLLNGDVVSIDAIAKQGVWINGGFFVLSGDFFEYMDFGEELVEEPFRRLIDQKKLKTYRHDGFWACMDTYKEMQLLEEMNSRGETPWAIWQANIPTVFNFDTVTDPPEFTKPS